MDLKVFDEKETSCALRALRDVVASNGTVTPAEARFLEVVAELHGTSVDVGSLGPVTGEEVASVVADPHRRKRLVQLAVIGGTSPSVSFPRGPWEGPSGSTARRTASASRARRAGSPSGWSSTTSDTCSRGTTRRRGGEIQQGAFQAGFVRQDGFAFLMFAVIQFHLGVEVTPVAEAQTGLFDVAKVLRAAQRGAACKVDLSDRWDPFPLADVPLDRVRADFGIPPL